MDPKDELIKILQDLRDTPDNLRRGRLQRLTKATLVQVAEVLLKKWERERQRLKIEVEKRDFHIERLEALVQPKPAPKTRTRTASKKR